MNGHKHATLEMCTQQDSGQRGQPHPTPRLGVRKGGFAPREVQKG